MRRVVWLAAMPISFRILAGFFVLLPGAGFVACGCSESKPRPNVVVIVMDTARPDYFSAYGHPRPTTPFLEEFAENATRFDRAYSTSSWTLPAHASLFSGLLPEDHGAVQGNPVVDASVPLLAERLRAAGYQSAAISENIWISPKVGITRGFEHYVRSRHMKQGASYATVEALRSWLTSKRDPTRPFFAFVNLIDPHMPYRPGDADVAPFTSDVAGAHAASAGFFPPGKPAFTTERHYTRKLPLSEPEWTKLRALYEGDLRATDAVVRALVTAVDENSSPAGTLIFVLSDHGENLGDHDHISHVFNVYDSNLRIALFARGPGFEGGTVDTSLTQITDLYPTILHAAGLEPEPSSVGLDLRTDRSANRVLVSSLDFPTISLGTFPPSVRQDGGPLDAYKRTLQAGIFGRWKLIVDSRGSAELFDILADPHERTPLQVSQVESATMLELRAALEAANQRAQANQSPLPMDAEMRAELKNLGYAGDDH